MIKDLKYLMAYSIAIIAFIGILAGGPLVYLTVVYTFIFIPILESNTKEYINEYSDDEKKSRNLDPFFDFLLYLNIPIVFGIFFVSLDTLLYTDSVSEIIGIILSTSIVMATNGINVGHELGHRKSLFSRTCSKLLYLPCQYMHFFIEHNKGHHKHVATASDPSTAKYNQSLYAFWPQTLMGTYLSAWKIANEELSKKGQPIFSLRNEMLLFQIIQLLFLVGIFILFGITTTLLFMVAALMGGLLLESVNYIEHYGLTRNETENHQFERVQPHHSWNSNHIIGRLMLFELSRHSDHHYLASRKYQILRSFDNAPQMPTGYPGMILLSLVPPLWFKVMNNRMKKYNLK